MLNRLRHLYKSEIVEKTAKRWLSARANGRGDAVDQEKDAYCRRMYNVSQYMKTLKQRISQAYNKFYQHEGQLWDGRFHSVLVDRRDDLARLYVTAYIELNSYRTKRRIPPQDWQWCSYATAHNGDSPLSNRAREGYEKMFSVSWEEVSQRLESVFTAETTENGDCPPQTMVALVKSSCHWFERGGFVSRDRSFAESVLSCFSPKFPTASARSIRFFRRLKWEIAA